MKKLDQRGTGILELLLILVVIGIVGGTGWYVWNSHQKTNQTLDDSSSQTNTTTPKKTTSTRPAGTATYMEIKEWGVKLNVGETFDATYKIVDGNFAYLNSSATLREAACKNYYDTDRIGFVSVMRGKATEQTKGDYQPPTFEVAAKASPDKYTKVGEHYYYLTKGNGMSCGSTAENTLDTYLESKALDVQML